MELQIRPPPMRLSMCGALHRVKPMCTNNCEPKHQETLQQLLTEVDKARKDINNVVYSHQLQYDGEPMAFISNAEVTLQEKQNKVYRCVHSLADMAGLPQSSCLDLALKILNQ